MDEPKKTGEGSVTNIKVTNLDVDNETSAAPVEPVIEIDTSENSTSPEEQVVENEATETATAEVAETAEMAVDAETVELMQDTAEPEFVQPTKPVTDQAEVVAQDTELQNDTEPVLPVAPTTGEPVASDIEGMQISPDHKHGSNKKLVVVIALIVGLLLLAAGAVLALGLFKNDEPETTSNTQQVKVALMGAELSVVDGLVQSSNDNKLWLDVKLGDQVAEGSYIRAKENGRAVIALDDGSAIRINSNSVVKLDSLDATNVVITNEAGEVYTRLVKSDRKFSVKVADESYEAMGTAYITVNTDDAKGVEVYESKVKLAKNNIEVPEGKYYYNEAKNAEQLKKLTDLNVDELKKDAFLAWNYQQDKAKTEFKDKLGYLTKIDEQKPAVKSATETAKPAVTTPTATNGISLSGVKYDTGVKLSWNLTNVTAPKGFKVVKSLTANPTFGKDEAAYVSDPNAKSYAWTIKDGKTYHFRVCVYSVSGCTEYSNNITVTAPKVAEAPKPAPTGTLTLNPAGGNDFNWVLKGSAPYGYKLVWSTAANPVYPGNDYEYYDAESTKMGSISPKTSGTYNVRVCMYNNGTCLNYSNNVVVTL